MCGGFTCSKNALISLNIIYILVSFILIGVAAYGKAASYLTSVSVVGGIIACGVFLLLLSIIGLIGAMRHHQVTLFFYMVVLFLLFILQFSISIACLALDEDKQMQIVAHTWNNTSNATKSDVQNLFHCCGFNTYDISTHPSCEQVDDCFHVPTGTPPPGYCISGSDPTDCGCPLCESKLKENLHRGMQLSGGLGLFFCFTEFIGVWLTARYRNQKNPLANPGAFL